MHLACHGHVDLEHPRLTGLVLAGGEVLTLDEIYRLPLRADLAVLSACRSGVGAVVNGEGVIGLVRGFLFAGSPQVVVSNWRVDDAGTSRFMESFYRRMVTGGEPAGRALRAAKLERLRAGGPEAHPFHWASFVLWGAR